MSGGQNYLLPVMDMAKVSGLLSVVNVFAQIQHPMSTPHYYSLPLILSVTHKHINIYVYMYINMYTCVYTYIYMIYIYVKYTVYI